jgi:hypothetical protein
MEDINGSLE